MHSVWYRFATASTPHLCLPHGVIATAPPRPTNVQAVAVASLMVLQLPQPPPPPHPSHTPALIVHMRACSVCHSCHSTPASLLQPPQAWVGSGALLPLTPGTRSSPLQTTRATARCDRPLYYTARCGGPLYYTQVWWTTVLHPGVVDHYTTPRCEGPLYYTQEWWTTVLHPGVADHCTTPRHGGPLYYTQV